jgi:ATP-dependent Clp protease ATP-binding subunit ClpC
MQRWLPGRGSRPAFHRFTDRARRVVVLAQNEARRLDHNYVGTEHILLGLIREGGGVAAQVLTRLGAEHDRVRGAILQMLAGHQSGRSEPAPPALRDYDEKITAARQQKDAALDAGDLDRAAALREEERRLLEEQARRLKEWSSGVDVAALAQETGQPRQEVTRLRNLLLRHNIQPDESQQQTP